MNLRSMRPTKDPRIVPAVVAATAADAASRTPLAVLEELLTHSIRLRDLYKRVFVISCGGTWPHARAKVLVLSA